MTPEALLNAIAASSVADLVNTDQDGRGTAKRDQNSAQAAAEGEQVLSTITASSLMEDEGFTDEAAGSVQQQVAKQFQGGPQV